MRRKISWASTAASRSCEQHCKTAVRKTTSQGCRNEFSTCLFFCGLFAFSERRTTHNAAARPLQDMQGVRTTDVIVRQPRICLRQPQDYHKVTVRFIARLSQECRETLGCSADTYDVSFCLATVLLLLHDCLVAAFHLT